MGRGISSSGQPDRIFSQSSCNNQRTRADASPIIHLLSIASNGSKYYLLFDRVQYPRTLEFCGAELDAEGHVDSNVAFDGTFFASIDYDGLHVGILQSRFRRALRR